MLKEFLAVILVVFTGIFFYVEVGAQIDPTVDVFTYDENWDETGVIDNLESNALLYPEQNDEGTWTGFLIEEDRSRVVNVFMEGDQRDGVVELTIRAWEGEAEGEPNETYTFEMTEPVLDVEIEDAVNYDVFEPEIFMEETQGSDNQRPNVDVLELSFERDTGVGLPELLLVVMLLGSFMVFFKKST